MTITLLNQTRLHSMLGLQNTLNCLLDPNWINLGWDNRRAIRQELSEAIDHHGWKWWKNVGQPVAIERLQLELIDAFHFLLAIAIEEGYDAERLHLMMEIGTTANVSNLSLLQALDDFITEAGRRGKLLYMLHHWQICCHIADLSMDQVYLNYIGKNTLNIFRARNGYREGTYIKDWFGHEDNDTLQSLMAGGITDPNDLLIRLAHEYKRVQEHA